MSLLSEKSVSVVSTQNLVAEQVLTQHVAGLQNETTALYDFALSGGAITVVPITLALTKPIPAGSAITQVGIQAINAFTSGGAATVSLGLNTNTDIANAVAFNGATFVGTSVSLPTVRAATNLSYLKMSIGAAALTAGKYQVRILYI
jgi:hypothetical protein